MPWHSHDLADRNPLPVDAGLGRRLTIAQAVVDRLTPPQEDAERGNHAFQEDRSQSSSLGMDTETRQVDGGQAASAGAMRSLALHFALSKASPKPSSGRPMSIGFLLASCTVIFNSLPVRMAAMSLSVIVMATKQPTLVQVWIACFSGSAVVDPHHDRLGEIEAERQL